MKKLFKLVNKQRKGTRLMAKRDFVMLAHTYKGGEPIGSWFCSEKLDGVRAYWDGAMTRGMLCKDVPFANVEKDDRYINVPRATGLWSRYGKAIQAPEWWLNRLPVGLPLDGELYRGRSEFQSLISIVKRLIPGPEWNTVQFKVFDSPPYHATFANGEISNVNFKKRFVGIQYPRSGPGADASRCWNFTSVLRYLQGAGIENDVVQILPQDQLAPASRTAQDQVRERLDAIITGAGEGLMLRHPTSFWVPQRSRQLLKAKGMLDSEAQVIGYVFGREGKLLGLMGAMIVKWNSRIFELSGFTDEERWLMRCGAATDQSAYDFGCEHPGERVPEPFHNPRFPIGSLVSFRYRELTDDKVPKEARFLRKHDDI